MNKDPEDTDDNTDVAVASRELPLHLWPQHADTLTGDLVRAGLLAEKRWQDAFRQTPRHLLIAYDLTGLMDAAFSGWALSEAAMTDAFLTGAFLDPFLDPFVEPVTDVVPEAEWTGVGQAPPGALAWVVEHLCGHDGPVRVLQIGAGDGYLTALLCHGLGDRYVVATEPDPRQADTTRARLADLGWHPTILTCRPHTDLRGPYDVVLDIEPRPRRSGRALASDRTVSWDQLAPSGRMIHTDPLQLGTLVVNDRAAGHPAARGGGPGRRRPALIDPYRLARDSRQLMPDGPGGDPVDRAVRRAVGSGDRWAVLLGEHVADEYGRCRGCADAGLVALTPCVVHTAAASECRCTP